MGLLTRKWAHEKKMACLESAVRANNRFGGLKLLAPRDRNENENRLTERSKRTQQPGSKTKKTGPRKQGKCPERFAPTGEIKELSKQERLTNWRHGKET